MSFFRELKRRNVFRVAVAYVVTAWLLLQVADLVLEGIEAPPWVMKAMLLVVALGFVAALVISWVYELTPEGLKPQQAVDQGASITHVTGRKLDIVIIAALVLALGYFAWERQHLRGPTSEQSAAEPAPAEAAPAMPGPADDKSIAVLPFVNLSSDPEQDYFSDGISEELLNVLAQVPGLRVAARTSSFSFKDQNVPIGEIAEALNVAHVLEGSVRKSGEQLRITAQLIKAEDGFHLWSQTWDRELDDVFAIQDEIARQTSEAMRVELALAPSRSGGSGTVIEPTNTEAYEAYLKGRQLVNRRGRSSLEAAEHELERSLRLDEDYGPAHAQLAIAIGLLLNSPSSYGGYTLEEVTALAEPHIERAFELTPNLAEAHGARALLALDWNDGETCIEQTQAALAINPSYTDALNWDYLCQSIEGNYRAAQQSLETLVRYDPLNYVGRYNYVNQMMYRRQFDRAFAMADSLMEEHPWAGHTLNATNYGQGLGELTTAIFHGLQAYAVEPEDTFAANILIDFLGFVGLHDEARRINRDLVYRAEAGAGNFELAVDLLDQQLRNDPDNAVLLLERADALHASGRVTEAVPGYEKIIGGRHGNRVIQDLLHSSPEANARLALGQRRAGDEADAQQMLQRLQRDLDARQEANMIDNFTTRTRAMAAMLEGQPDAALDHLEEALERGMRERSIFEEPIFEPLRDNPRFVELRERLNRTLADEREDVLQLLCHHNPVPDAWRPLPATCEGVAPGPDPLAP